MQCKWKEMGLELGHSEHHWSHSSGVLPDFIQEFTCGAQTEQEAVAPSLFLKRTFLKQSQK